MYSRWYQVTVVLLWLAAMGWLVVEKVFPSLMVGDAPNAEKILAAQQAEPAVAWKLQVHGRPLGWAVGQTIPSAEGQVEMRNRVHFDRLPLDEFVPGLIRDTLQVGGVALEADAFSLLVFDSLHQLARFESTLLLANAGKIKIRGAIDDKGEMEIRIAYNDRELPDPVKLRVGKAMFQDSLSPRSRLPGLRPGQSWTIEIISPLGDPNNPTEILHAQVEGESPMVWEGHPVSAWVVVVRGDPGGSLGGASDLRGKMWVHPAGGMILKQEVILLGKPLTFTRLSEEESAKNAKYLEDSEWQKISQPLLPAIPSLKHRNERPK